MKLSQKAQLLVLCLFITGISAFAQNLPAGVEQQPAQASKRQGWICPGAEMALFSLSSTAYGGSFSAGYGDGAAIGIKAAWLTETDDSIVTLELSFLLRFYFFGRNSLSGPFIQAAGGPVFFTQSKNIPSPAEAGRISAGLGLGWRFPVGERWFVEGSIRAGYPFLVGGGVSAGLCF